MLSTTSAARAAAAGESATRATPNASAYLLVRSQTETSKPWDFSLRTMAPPIFPAPMTATLISDIGLSYQVVYCSSYETSCSGGRGLPHAASPSVNQRGRSAESEGTGGAKAARRRLKISSKLFAGTKRPSSSL